MLTKAFATHWVQHQLTPDYSDSTVACPGSASAFLQGRRPSLLFFFYLLHLSSLMSSSFVHGIHFIHNCNSKTWHIRLVRVTAGLNPQSSSKVESNYFCCFLPLSQIQNCMCKKVFQVTQLLQKAFLSSVYLISAFICCCESTRAWKLRGGKFLFSCRCSVDGNCS